jgi:hypothetical protein
LMIVPAIRRAESHFFSPSRTRVFTGKDGPDERRAHGFARYISRLGGVGDHAGNLIQTKKLPKKDRPRGLTIVRTVVL